MKETNPHICRIHLFTINHFYSDNKTKPAALILNLVDLHTLNNLVQTGSEV